MQNGLACMNAVQVNITWYIASASIFAVLVNLIRRTLVREKGLSDFTPCFLKNVQCHL